MQGVWLDMYYSVFAGYNNTKHDVSSPVLSSAKFSHIPLLRPATMLVLACQVSKHCQYEINWKSLPPSYTSGLGTGGIK